MENRETGGDLDGLSQEWIWQQDIIRHSRLGSPLPGAGALDVGRCHLTVSWPPRALTLPWLLEPMEHSPSSLAHPLLPSERRHCPSILPLLSTSKLNNPTSFSVKDLMSVISSVACLSLTQTCWIRILLFYLLALWLEESRSTSLCLFCQQDDRR